MDKQDLPICTACGMLYDTPSGRPPSNCNICDDPRQFVPPEGQSWTTLREIKQAHHNIFEQHEESFWSIRTEPRFPIGQRAFLIQTPEGNVLWDMIALLDEDTVDFINSKGALKAIVISHPHYYTTYGIWAETFDCPVYLASEDACWAEHVPAKPELLETIEGVTASAQEIVPGVMAIKAGGHFPGSLLLHWRDTLFIADTIVTVPSAFTPYPRPPGQTTFAFMWSIPNMIPLTPDQVLGIWKAIEAFEFEGTYGAFKGMDLKDKDLKNRMLDSMQIQVRTGGWEEHNLFLWKVDEVD